MIPVVQLNAVERTRILTYLPNANWGPDLRPVVCGLWRSELTEKRTNHRGRITASDVGINLLDWQGHKC